jgi:hypothetical protein
MAYSESLAARIRQALGRARGLVEKKMFGGMGFLLSGNLCVGVWKNSLMAVRHHRPPDEGLAPHRCRRTGNGRAAAVVGDAVQGICPLSAGEIAAGWVNGKA